MDTKRKKLIEVSLPLEAINEAAKEEKSVPRRGHPQTLHYWWARRPLAVCRAVLFASLVDDPSNDAHKFPTSEAQDKERQRLFNIMEELVKWENLNNERVLESARAEIKKSTGENLPPVLDPFCGGGSIPLEAQRMGLTAYASDLNPVAVLITKALVEIPPKFTGNPPVHPGGQNSFHWQGAKGLAEDVRYYGKWVRDEVEKRIGHLYPKAQLPKEYGHGEATVLAWLWARTVKCPNPICGVQMPLIRSFHLSHTKKKDIWVEPVIDKQAKRLDFEVKTSGEVPSGGTVTRRGARCIACGSVVPFAHIRTEGKAKRMGEQLMAIMAENQGGRIYLAPSRDQEKIKDKIELKNIPESNLPETALGFRVQLYGMTKFRDIFTPRQLMAISTFCDLVEEARVKAHKDAIAAGMVDDRLSLCNNGVGAQAYAEAISVYLGCALSRLLTYNNTICFWNIKGGSVAQIFARQAIPMSWDYIEINPVEKMSGNWLGGIDWIGDVIENLLFRNETFVKQLDATSAINGVIHPLISTDPPYYDNIGYADLSDFFYIWLRRCLEKVYPNLFSTMLTPKTQELVATPYRFGGDKEKAKKFFESGLVKTFTRMRDVQNPKYPLTVYYAFKQSEKGEEGDEKENNFSSIVSTGWETILEALLKAGFTINGTWPMRTERPSGVKIATNALASSIVLVCRARPENSPITTRRDFLNTLKKELPQALKTLQQGNIAPVDLAQSAIGPGMAVFSHHGKVLEADGTPMRVRTALGLINQVLDEYLTEQEGEYDADTRWGLAWFEQNGFEDGPFGDAETLSKAKNTSIGGLVEDGILLAKGGKVRLLKRDELSQHWDPDKDKRLTIWEVTQHLIHNLVDKGSEEAAASLLREVGGVGEVARDLAYRLYTICERKKWAQEALAYNTLVVAWPELVKLAGQQPTSEPTQTKLFDRG